MQLNIKKKKRKERKPINKWAEELNRHTDGQKAHVKKFNITNH